MARDSHGLEAFWVTIRNESLPRGQAICLIGAVSSASPLDSKKLEKLRQAGDLAGMVNFFRGSQAADRFAWEKPMLAAERAARRGDEEYSKWNRGRWEASLLALLACASWARLRNMRWTVGGPHFGDAEWSDWWREAQRLVAELRPAWVDEWAELLLRQNLDHWFFVRELVRRGLCRTPASDVYTLGMMRGLRWRFHTYVSKRGGGAESRFPTIADAILDDPGLLKDEIWRLFRVAGTSKCNLQSLEPVQRTNWKLNAKMPAEVEEHSWRFALGWLADKGKLPRGRVLDESLAALDRGFESHHAGWFFRLHDELAPTLAERTARQEKYLVLLACPHPNVSTWALQTVAELDKEQPLPAAMLLKHLSPAFALEAKASVKTALQLTGRAAAREPRRRGDLLILATQALDCEAADVQGELFKLLDQHGDRGDLALKKALAARASGVAPSWRARFAEWGAGRAGAKPATTAATPKGVSPPIATAASPLHPAHRLVLIASPDELLERIDFILDHPEDIDEVECVLAALVRLGKARPADFAAKSEDLRRHILRAGWPQLGHGAEAMVGADFMPKSHAYSVNSVTKLLAWVLESWRIGKVLWPMLRGADDLNQTQRFLFQRLAGISRLIHRGVTLPLLSTPTHRGGWIAPGEFVSRLEAWQRAGELCDPDDFCLALLRLASENRGPALNRLQDLIGEVADAARHALGEEDTVIGPTAPFWIAAARARTPFLDDPAVEKRHPGLGPDAGRAARLGWFTEQSVEFFKNPLEQVVASWLKIKPNPNRAFMLDSLCLSVDPPLQEKMGATVLPVLMHGPWEGDGLNYREEASILRWAFTFWPASREPLFGALALWLMGATQSFQYRQGYRHVFMEVAFARLEDPFTRPGPMASLLHAFALLSPDAECRGRGARALRVLVESGRFSAPALGTTLARLLGTSIGKAGRLADSLAEVARVSPAHAVAVRGLIEEAMDGDPAKAPKDVAKLLELLVELVSADGVALTHPTARDYVGRLPEAGRMKRLLTQLLGG